MNEYVTLTDDRSPAVASARPRASWVHPPRVRPFTDGASPGAPARGEDMTRPAPHNAGSTPQPPQHQLQQGPPAAGSSRRNLIVAVAVIALIAIIGLVVWLVTKKSPDQGAPQTGSIQQPAVSSAGGYTPIDPATMASAGAAIPKNAAGFLSQEVEPNFLQFTSSPSMADYNASGSACWYLLNTNGQWAPPRPGGITGTVTCGPVKGGSGPPSWWTHEVALDSSGNEVLSKGQPQDWSPLNPGNVPRGFRPDGRPLPTAG